MSQNYNNRNGRTASSSRPNRNRVLTQEEKHRIAKRRAVKRRKVYFFRTLFASILILIFLGIIKIINFLFSGDTEAVAQVSNTAQDEIIDENYQQSVAASEYDYVVCIDPGHGFDDEGARSDVVNNAVERDIVFNLAKRVKEILNDNEIGVILTHTTNKVPSDYKGDQYLFGLEERVSYANSLDIDFYVSIHCDFYENDSSITGSRIYYMQNESGTIEETATLFSDSILSSMNESEPLLIPMTENEAYYVLKYTNVPALLVETGFLSNKTETKNMLTDKWRNKMAQGIANGIISAFENGYFN